MIKVILAGGLGAMFKCCVRSLWDLVTSLRVTSRVVALASNNQLLLATARKEAELLLDPGLLPSDWSAETLTGIIDIYVETETTGRSY